MSYSQPARTAGRRRRRTILSAALVLCAVSLGAAGFFQQGGGPQDPRPLTEADGLVSEGATVFDGGLPAVANLDPDLFAALHVAAIHAADYGVDLVITSGWRSMQYQDQLLQGAIAEYGSEEEAARWVATAETSPHVSGDAVDVGPASATAWLSVHGAGYGLCQIYDNEPWHYEWRPDAVHRGCPPTYADPTQDPRMHLANGPAQ